MSLPPLATPDDLVDEVGDQAAETSPRAVRVLARASTLVRAYTGRTFLAENGDLVDPVPDEAFEVTLAAAARAWRNPTGVIQDTTGPYTVRYDEDADAGVYLTTSDEQMLNRLKDGAGLWTQPVDRCDPYLREIAPDLDPLILGCGDAARW